MKTVSNKWFGDVWLELLSRLGRIFTGKPEGYRVKGSAHLAFLGFVVVATWLSPEEFAKTEKHELRHTWQMKQIGGYLKFAYLYIFNKTRREAWEADARRYAGQATRADMDR